MTAYSAYAGRRVWLDIVAVPRTLIRIEVAPSNFVVRQVGKWPVAPQAAKLPVIMVSVQTESQYALRCLRAGATEYVNKNSVSEELVPAIKKILDSGAKSLRKPNGNSLQNPMNPLPD